jgi:hypothetical protein
VRLLTSEDNEKQACQTQTTSRAAKAKTAKMHIKVLHKHKHEHFTKFSGTFKVLEIVILYKIK